VYIFESVLVNAFHILLASLHIVRCHLTCWLHFPFLKDLPVPKQFAHSVGVVLVDNWKLLIAEHILPLRNGFEYDSVFEGSALHSQ
jgi:hypothetical protein